MIPPPAGRPATSWFFSAAWPGVARVMLPDTKSAGRCACGAAQQVVG